MWFNEVCMWEEITSKDILHLSLDTPLRITNLDETKEILTALAHVYDDCKGGFGIRQAGFWGHNIFCADYWGRYKVFIDTGL